MEALRGSRDVLGIGADSTGRPCDRAVRALAAQLDVEPVISPGGHIGFADDPAGFAPALKPHL